MRRFLQALDPWPLKKFLEHRSRQRNAGSGGGGSKLDFVCRNLSRKLGKSYCMRGRGESLTGGAAPRFACGFGSCARNQSRAERQIASWPPRKQSFARPSAGGRLRNQGRRRGPEAARTLPFAVANLARRPIWWQRKRPSLARSPGPRKMEPVPRSYLLSYIARKPRQRPQKETSLMSQWPRTRIKEEGLSLRARTPDR